MRWNECNYQKLKKKTFKSQDGMANSFKLENSSASVGPGQTPAKFLHPTGDIHQTLYICFPHYRFMKM